MGKRKWREKGGRGGWMVVLLPVAQGVECRMGREEGGRGGEVVEKRE